MKINHIRKDIEGECCRKCTEVDDCEQNLFRCKKAIDSIFHKNQI